MKRKYILAAAALAVLCVGTVAYSMKQNTELPSDAPNSSSAPSSIASSEPESGSTSVTDNRDIAKAENFVTYQVFKEEATTGTETHPEDQVNVSDEQLTEGQQKSKEIAIQGYMDYYGMTREEAEVQWQEDRAEGEKKREEAEQKREEIAAQREEEEQAFDAAMDQWYLEHTGMAADQFGALSIQEKTEWIRQHPDVDFSTSPERTWDWQN